MSNQTLKRLGVALVALVVLWLGATLARGAARDEEQELGLSRFDPKAVDEVTISGPADTLRFRRTGAVWSVNGHRADSAMVFDVLAALADTALRSELIAENATSHQRLGLDSAGGRRLAVLQGGAAVAEVLIGRRGSSVGTVYVRRPGDDAAYQVTGRLAAIADRSLDDWRDKVVARVEPDSVAAVEVQRGSVTYRLTRGEKGWTLGSAPADSAAVAGLLERLRTVTASGFASAAQADSADFAKPDRVVRALRKGGGPALALHADSTANGFWVRRDGDSTTFRMDSWVLDQLTPEEGSVKKR